MSITRAELKRIINQSVVLPVTEEEFKSLMYILDPGHTNLIDCENFLSLFRLVNKVYISLFSVYSLNCAGLSIV